MEQEKTAAKGWTEVEKVHSHSHHERPAANMTVQNALFLQIIAKAGKIPWSEIELPPGRTEKACTVMIDREKKKVRDSAAAKGESGGEGEAKGKAKLKSGGKVCRL